MSELDPDFTDKLLALRERVEILSRTEQTASPAEDENLKTWRTLSGEIEKLCRVLEKSEPETARTALPVLSAIIRDLDRVIEGLQNP